MSEIVIAEVPALLEMPPKLVQLLANFHRYKYFLIDGGRGSGKTQAVARLILYLGSLMRQRTLCGRETQASIEDSVYTVLRDICAQHSLDYNVRANRFDHNATSAEIIFRGFREQGAINIKGLEGVGIVWIDEAQAITKNTLDVLIPTIRRDDCKLIFTMNRLVRDDPVFTFLADREDCLRIHIDYFENPFCPETLKLEAEACRARSEAEYNHIWLGRPLDRSSDYLFSTAALERAKTVETYSDYPLRQRVMAVDFAAQGGDLCVATVLDRQSELHWRVTEQITWDDADTMASTGRIAALMAQKTPNITILDHGGMGHVVYDRLVELRKNIIPFRGEMTSGVNLTHYANTRSEGYYLLQSWVEQGWLLIPPENKTLFSQLEQSIRFRYRSNGQRLIVPKDDMRKAPYNQKSPDHADSLMMAVWGVVRYLGSIRDAQQSSASIRRVSSNSRRFA